MAQYRLIFSGTLLHGVDRTKCIEQLAKFFETPPDVLARKLFSGRRVVIKRTDDKRMVKVFVAAFKKAGAKLLIDVIDEKAEQEKKRMMSSDVTVTRTRPAFSRSDIKRPPTKDSGDEIPESGCNAADLDNDETGKESSGSGLLRRRRRKRRR